MGVDPCEVWVSSRKPGRAGGAQGCATTQCGWGAGRRAAPQPISGRPGLCHDPEVVRSETWWRTALGSRA
eukprot:2911894-Prymnesium_polylepis.1